MLHNKRHGHALRICTSVVIVFSRSNGYANRPWCYVAGAVSVLGCLLAMLLFRSDLERSIHCCCSLTSLVQSKRLMHFCLKGFIF